MPNKQEDISINLPKELLNSISEVLRVGLLKAKIPPEDRKNLSFWWKIEEELIRKEK